MKRTTKQLKEHYQIEKELATKLKQSSREEREYLYSSLYDELYRRVPLHPQNTRKNFSEGSASHVYAQMRFIRRFNGKDKTFVEIGPGDCSLSFEMCKHVKKVYAADVSKEISNQSKLPENFELIISDGTSIPLPSESVDIVYSNQVMEHIHPDDAIVQLNNIKNILKKGGKYICVTPNRINGPHDISRYFDEVATGFHLKEYTYSELNSLFEQIGFKSSGYVGAYGIYLKTPIGLLSGFERLLNSFPMLIRRSFLFKPMLTIRIVGIK